MNDGDFRRVTNELKKTLKKNSNLLYELAKKIVDELYRFCNLESSPEDDREAARKIADTFGLDTNFLRVGEEYADDTQAVIAISSFLVKRSQ